MYLNKRYLQKNSLFLKLNALERNMKRNFIFLSHLYLFSIFRQIIHDFLIVSSIRYQ